MKITLTKHRNGGKTYRAENQGEAQAIRMCCVTDARGKRYVSTDGAWLPILLIKRAEAADWLRSCRKIERGDA